MGQPLQTLAWGSENKLNYEHLRIFLIHTGNKIALQFHKINVPVYIYRKQTVHTLGEALEERERERVKDQNRKTSQKPYRQIQCSAKQAQLYIKTCNCSVLGTGRAKK